MILVKDSDLTKRQRNIRTINVVIDEPPERPHYVFRSEKDMVKFTKKIEMLVRHSLEYRQYIKFLRDTCDMRRCAILKGICNTEGKHYTIEIHHEPFNLFQIVQIVIAKYQSLGMDLNPYQLANEVMQLHYDGKVGLIPLSATQHKLVHRGDIFIPMQKIYQNYIGFVQEYEEYIPDKISELIEFKVQMSQKCGEYQAVAGILDPEFVYVNVDGYEFPSVPDEWGVKKQALEDAIENPSNDAPMQYRIGDDLSVPN